MNKKRILSFYYKHKSGGFTARLYKAWLGLVNDGYELTYISTEKLPVDSQHITAHIIACRGKPGTALFWGEYFIKAIFSARKIIKNEQVSCFVVFSFFYASLSILSGFGSRIKTLVFIRADDVYMSSIKSSAKLRTRLHIFLERFSLNYASIAVATNQKMLTSMQSRNNAKADMYCLPNNIVNANINYTEEKYSNEDGIYRFVTASVLNEGKNILYTLQALHKMKSTNWKFLIVGDDIENTGYGKLIEQYILNHKLQNKIKLLGWKDDADKLVSHCDLFIISTIMEGSPNALLEALGTNISCLGSDIPEISEILDYPELVFDLNNPASLSETLDQFCKENEFRLKLADLSSKCRERYVFDWEKRVIGFVEKVAVNDK